MIRRWGRYVTVAYPLRVQLPVMLSWAVGLTALFAAASHTIDHWRPDGESAVTAVTLVIDMLLLRALDDLRDHAYDLTHNPSRPLPSGLVSPRDLEALVAVGAVALLLLNAGRGPVFIALLVQLCYGIGVMTVDRLAGWPPADRLWLGLALNLPIQTLLSLYVYVGFLRAERQQPDLVGLLILVAATLCGLCLELGRKTTRHPRPGERTYVTVLGPAMTSTAAMAAATAAAAIVLVILRPWHDDSPVHAWGWLVVLPLALPAVAALRFSAGTPRWPGPLLRSYLPAVYISFLAIGWLTKGALS
jgi:4-hydroxybenzoate polyprenyltransferase